MFPAEVGSTQQFGCTRSWGMGLVTTPRMACRSTITLPFDSYIMAEVSGHYMASGPCELFHFTGCPPLSLDRPRNFQSRSWYGRWHFHCLCRFIRNSLDLRLQLPRSTSVVEGRCLSKRKHPELVVVTFRTLLLPERAH